MRPFLLPANPPLRPMLRQRLVYHVSNPTPQEELAMNRRFALASTLALILTVASAFAQPPAPPPAAAAKPLANGNSGAESCSHSPICGWGRGRNTITHELHKPDLGFTYAYPFALPPGLSGGVSAIALN